MADSEVAASVGTGSTQFSTNVGQLMVLRFNYRAPAHRVNFKEVSKDGRVAERFTRKVDYAENGSN